MTNSISFPSCSSEGMFLVVLDPISSISLVLWIFIINESKLVIDDQVPFLTNNGIFYFFVDPSPEHTSTSQTRGHKLGKFQGAQNKSWSRRPIVINKPCSIGETFLWEEYKHTLRLMSPDIRFIHYSSHNPQQQLSDDQWDSWCFLLSS